MSQRFTPVGIQKASQAIECEREQRPIQVALDSNLRELARLRDSLSRLANRLEPVLVNVPASQSAEAPQPSPEKLVNVIDARTIGVREAADLIEELLDRAPGDPERKRRTTHMPERNVCGGAPIPLGHGSGVPRPLLADCEQVAPGIYRVTTKTATGRDIVVELHGAEDELRDLAKSEQTLLLFR